MVERCYLLKTLNIPVKKFEEVWGRCDQCGTTSRAVPSPAGLACGGELKGIEPTRKLDCAGMWILIDHLMTIGPQCRRSSS